jgi:hypothetical protein
MSIHELSEKRQHMTDDISDKKTKVLGDVAIDEIEEAHHEPDFAPVAAAPVFDDAAEDEDPHSEPFHKTDVAESAFIDPYGVGVPRGHGDELGYEDDEEEDDPGYLMPDTDSY